MLIRRSVLIASIISASMALAADWPQWRGPNRDGNPRRPDCWIRGRRVGRAWSGKRRVSVKGIPPSPWWASVSSRRGSRATRSSLSPSTLLPVKSFGERRPASAGSNDKGNGPRGAPRWRRPAVRLSADGTLVCLEIATGKRIWGLNLVEKLRRPAAALAIHRIAAGGWRPPHRHARRAEQPSVVALNKKPASSSGSRKAISRGLFLGRGVRYRRRARPGPAHRRGCHRAGRQEWRVQWRYAKVANRTANIATPIAHDGYVLHLHRRTTPAACC